MSGHVTKLSELMNFTEKQLAAQEMADKHQFFLYGGARGPGKSYWMRRYSLRELFLLYKMDIRNAIVGLFCEDYVSLTDRQVNKIAAEFPSWLGEVKTTKAAGFGFYLKPEYGGGVIALRNLDDPSKYKSAEFAAIGIDELTRNKLEVFNLLRGSLRWPGVRKPKFYAATNPGGIGHGWVKAYWIDRNFPAELLPLAHEFAFLPALPDDNPHLDESYWRMLETLPAELANAWRRGSWDVNAGLFFSGFRLTENYAGQLPHVIPATQVPKGWQLFGSVDYGHNPRNDEEKPFSYGLYGADKDGHIYRVDELAGAYWDVGKQIEEIKKLEARYDNRVVYRVACKSMFIEWKKGAPSIAEDYMAAGLQVVPPNTDRVNGWARCREYLQESPDGRPWFMCFDRCKQFISDVQNAIIDEKHPEDIDPNCFDHSLEEWRHLLMSRTTKPGEIQEGPVPYSFEWTKRERKKKEIKRRKQGSSARQ